MSEENKKLEIVFAPGCFDSFDGTQEELDEMVAEIQRLAESGELFERSTPVDVDALMDSLDDEEVEALMRQIDALDSDEGTTKRTLQ